MPESTTSLVSAYRALAVKAARRAHVPFTRQPSAVILVGADGSWIPGVRVESASFSLTIPAYLNAVTTAVALSVSDVRAMVSSRPLQPHEIAAAQKAHGIEGLPQTAPDMFGEVPDVAEPGPPLSPYVVRPDAPPGPNLPESREHEGREDPSLRTRRLIEITRAAAARAHVPASSFPVGCLLEFEDGRLVPGVNVEHEDWLQILCAERNALGTAVSYGLGKPQAAYLSCVRAPGCTPCGACRQLLAELAPASTLWMDRGERTPSSATPAALLPGSFSGDSI